MNWHEIITWIVGIIGTIGGVGGLVTLYNAKSNKDTIDINNFHSLIEEERTERKNLLEEYHKYKEEVNKKISAVKLEFEELKQDNQNQLKAIYQGYRCTLPKKLSDCPVIRMFQENCMCEDCREDCKTN